ncbi:MAG TPA: hypothetical protein VFC05_02620 [Nitrososphaeraceae archaeon]|nr:hypothetical protein [Nitrososphaeraceae archaeon]
MATSKLLTIVDQNTLNDIKLGAIVSRGGRTDLLNDTNIFDRITVTSLFIVGSKDNHTLKINKKQ